MKCNHCGIEFHESTQYSLGHRNHVKKTDFIVEANQCPSCKESNLYLIEGEYKTDSSGPVTRRYASNIIWRRPIFPFHAQTSTLPKDVPENYRTLHNEAYAVLPISPRSSAALARRLLELILIGQGAPKSQNLFEQIEWCLRSGLPSYISDTLDNVRMVGNFAAHIKQNIHTGEILEVEPGEAEFVLACVADLIDFYFVMPAIAKARSDAIQQKLETTKKNQGGQQGTPCVT